MEHNKNEGLVASVVGVKHGILVSVPVSLMEKAGTYYFVLHFKDNHADKYKDHQVKPALELNALWRGEKVALVGIKFFALDDAGQEDHFILYSRHLPKNIRNNYRRHLCPDSHPEHGHQKPFYPIITQPPQWKRYLYSTGTWKGKLTLCKYPERVAVPMGWRLRVRADIDANLPTPYIVRVKLTCEQMRGLDGQTATLTFTHIKSRQALSEPITIGNWDDEDYNTLLWDSSPFPLEVNRWVIRLKWEIWYYPQGEPGNKKYCVEPNTHVIYATVSRPLSCGGEEWGYPWYTILDRATEWARGKTSGSAAMEAITREVYDNNTPLFDYPRDTEWGYLRPFASLTSFDPTITELHIELDSNIQQSNQMGGNGLYPLLPNTRDLTNRYVIHTLETRAQCTDAASILITLFRSLGVDSTTLVIGYDFRTKIIDPIGAPDPNSIDWLFHQLGETSSGLYDACLTFPHSGGNDYVAGWDWTTYRNRLLDSGTCDRQFTCNPQIVRPYYHGQYRQGSQEEANL